jgi:hypothetical protein
MVVIALLWGNCAQCTQLLPAAPGHDCCDQTKKGCHEAPVSKQTDCNLNSVDLAKALVGSAHHDVAPVAIAPTRVPELGPVYAATQSIASLPTYSPPDVWLLDSAILI